MTPHELLTARILWSCLLDLDDAGLLSWQAWAEEAVLKIDFVAPFWLCELTVAPSAQAALACVRDGIGLEYAEYPADEIDEEAIIFGLLYSKFARNEEWAKEAWRVMADFGDPVSYVESGQWRQYQRDRELDISGMSVEASTALIFRPVAAYALRTVRKTIGKPASVRRLFIA